jgi:hypothetical protein
MCCCGSAATAVERVLTATWLCDSQQGESSSIGVLAAAHQQQRSLRCFVQAAAGGQATHVVGVGSAVPAGGNTQAAGAAAAWVATVIVSERSICPTCFGCSHQASRCLYN